MLQKKISRFNLQSGLSGLQCKIYKVYHVIFTRSFFVLLRLITLLQSVVFHLKRPCSFNYYGENNCRTDIDFYYGKGFIWQTGTVIHQKFLALSIVGNPAGEVELGRMTIYLPPGYYQSKQRYPIIYFLDGMYGNDSATVDDLEINKLPDPAISGKHIKPVIFVLPNIFTK